ncbi:MAG: hypothetical protein J4G09_09895 [Proteobacteria bacterium]|nr:hypothetical protein [Pseudomonadota bacterium]
MKLFRESAVSALVILVRRLGVEAGRVVPAVFAHVGRQDLGVPAAARPEFDDRQLRPQAEELQRLHRIAVLVPGAVRLRAVFGFGQGLQFRGVGARGAGPDQSQPSQADQQDPHLLSRGPSVAGAAW